MKQFWRFVRDDVWTHVAMTLFCIGSVGLLVPLHRDMPQVYGRVVFIFGIIFFSLRILKLSILLAFGKTVTADLINVDYRKLGPSLVRYRYSDGDKTWKARRQIYNRNGELQSLFLPRLPRFHLVAWRKPASYPAD